MAADASIPNILKKNPFPTYRAADPKSKAQLTELQHLYQREIHFQLTERPTLYQRKIHFQLTERPTLYHKLN